jgi:hypothetical protein
MSDKMPDRNDRRTFGNGLQTSQGNTLVSVDRQMIEYAIAKREAQSCDSEKLVIAVASKRAAG